MRLVDVRNTQRKFPVDITAVQRNVALIKAQLGVSSFRVHVWFCSEPKVRGLSVRRVTNMYDVSCTTCVPILSLRAL